jgi:hypothetical protein
VQLRRQTYAILSGACLLVGATTTHGLGGGLRYKVLGRASRCDKSFSPTFLPFFIRL